jgi:ferric-dicitrate binding protein FerR (iron transport regulator)
MNKDQQIELMMTVLDGECSAEDRQRLEQALATDKELQQEWSELQRVKEVTKLMTFRKPPNEVWQDYWGSVYARLERGVAWIFISLGSVVLLSWTLWQMIQDIIADSSLPNVVKLALAALLIGLVVLAVSVVREKLFVRKTDTYKDIQR